MKLLIYTLVFFIISCNNNIKKEKKISDKILELILSEKKIGNKYKISNNKPKSILEYSIIYLGDLNVKNNKISFLLLSIHSGSYSPHQSNYLYLYDNNQNKIGNYYISSYEPNIINDSVIFVESPNICKLKTSISFKDSIPNSIFIKCNLVNNKILGDIYNFENEK